MVTEPASVLQEIAGILDRLGIPYAVGGALASGHHGEIRATNDVDVLVEIDVRGARRLVEALGSAWHVDTAAVESAVARGSSFSVIHLDRMLKVDFFVATDARLDRLQLARRVAVALGEAAEVRVWFTSPEDVVLRKLDGYRRSGGILDRQLRDVAGVLKARRTGLDLDYLRRAAAELGLLDLLDASLRGAGL